MGNAYIETEYDNDMDDCYPRGRNPEGVVRGESVVHVNVAKRNLYGNIREGKAVEGLGRSIPSSGHRSKDGTVAKDASRTSDRSFIRTESKPF